MGYTLHDLTLSRPTVAQQRIARNIMLNYYTRHGFAHFEAFLETLSNQEDPESYVPDILFVDGKGSAAVAVELCQQKKLSTQRLQ